MFNTLLDAPVQPEQPSVLMSLLPFLLIIVVFYFFMIRPQQQRQKALNSFRDKLEKGSHIVTTGGVYGKVVKVQDNKVTVEIADGVNVVFDKSAILEQAEPQQ